MTINKLQLTTEALHQVQAIEAVNALIDTTTGSTPVEAVTLKGLPQTAGAPAGWGDLSQNILSTMLGSLLSQHQPIGVHVYGNSFVQALTMQSAFSTQSKGKVMIVQSSGVGGNTSAQVLARLQTDGINPLARVLLFIEGTNDAGTGATAATHAANVKAIADYALDRGVVPIMCVTPPRDGSFSAASNLNALQDQLIGLKYFIPTFDLFSKWVDPLDGTWLSGASNDGTHPTQAVYDLSGRELWRAANERQPNYLIPRTNAGNGLIGSNVLQFTDTNADGLPDGWSAGFFTGQSYPAMQDYAHPFRGKRARITMEQTAGGAILFKQVSPSGKFSTDDDIYVSGVLGVDAISGAKITCYVRVGGVGLDVYLATFANVSDDLYVSCRFKVPAGATNMQITIRFDPADGADPYGATIGYGCFDFYNITTQCLI